MDGTNPFFVTIQDKIKELVEAKGDELTDPGNDVTKQISHWRLKICFHKA